MLIEHEATERASLAMDILSCLYRHPRFNTKKLRKACDLALQAAYAVYVEHTRELATQRKARGRR